MSSIKLIEIQKKEKHMWKPGEPVAARGIFRNRVWIALPILVVKDTPEEVAVTLLPGAVCMTEKDYAAGKKNGKRRWDFKDADWELAPFRWSTQRLLILMEPDKFYSIRLFWQAATGTFLGYYVNFQLPVTRSHCGLDSLDLELDITIHPDLSFEWKDLDDYQKGIAAGIILPEWIDEIESAKREVFGKLEKRLYPFDGAWLDWRPNPNWPAPTLPKDWDKV
jgi:hypothetical protein